MRKAQALMFAIVMTIIAGVFATMLANMWSAESELRKLNELSMRCFYLAQAGIARGKAILVSDPSPGAKKLPKANRWWGEDYLYNPPADYVVGFDIGLPPNHGYRYRVEIKQDGGASDRVIISYAEIYDKPLDDSTGKLIASKAIEVKCNNVFDVAPADGWHDDFMVNAGFWVER